MLQGRLIGVLLRPSIVSGVICGTASLTLLLLSAWENLTHNSIFHNFFVGQNGIEAAVTEFNRNLGASVSAQLAQPWIYNVIILLGAIAIAVAIYVILQFATRMTNSFVHTADIAEHSSQAIKHAMAVEIGSRILVRIILAVIWFFYIQLALAILVPLCIVVGKDGILNMTSISGLLECLLAGLGLFTILHINVILLRLLLMRPRAFGGTYVIMNALE
jgi:hypothetical protein